MSATTASLGNAKPSTKKIICFFHPDLGIGGAERLVIDAAVGLQGLGHKVVIFTSHCDPKHCFEEARDGTLDVRVRGNTLIPSSILSRFTIICAILRQIHLLLQIYFSGELAALRPTSFFVDQLSAGLPLLSLISPAGSAAVPILFYCHFPDLLLAKGRQSWWKRLYRVPFDGLEDWSMGFADAVAVNSRFTRGVVRETWAGLEGKVGRELVVVYPCIDTTGAGVKGSGGEGEGEEGVLKQGEGKLLLSINRFERKKDVGLAIRAFAGLHQAKRKGVRLVIAGGYDNRVAENVACHDELVKLADSLGLRSATTSTVVTALAILQNTLDPLASSAEPASKDRNTSTATNTTTPQIDVLFLLSIPTSLKQTLLSSATLLLYTPSNEHFGIVPLEAMLARVPVLAANTGGPTETVIDGETGWLRDPDDVGQWTKVVDQVLNEMTRDELVRVGEMGEKRVRDGFGADRMAGVLDGVLGEIERGRARKGGGGGWEVGMESLIIGGLGAMVVAALAVLVMSVVWT